MDWTTRLHEVAERYPKWYRTVKPWDALAELYDAEDFKALYAFLSGALDTPKPTPTREDE